ncbi:MAG: hypothetical protein AB7G93_17260 [Bdellovibrionales bacterium]
MKHLVVLSAIATAALTFPPLSQARPNCPGFLLPQLRTEALRSGIETAVGELNRLGLKTLTQSWNSQQVDVSFRHRRFPWQGNVDGRTSDSGRRKHLIVRELPNGSESDRQMAVWDVALALYELELKSGPELAGTELSVPMSASEDDLLPFLLIEASRQNVHARLRHAAELQREIYALLDHLPKVEASQVLWRRDPARHLRFTALLGLDTALGRTRPNQADLTEAREDRVNVSEQLDRRYRRNSMAASYLRVLHTLVLTAHLIAPFGLETPSQVEARAAHEAFQRELDQAPARAQNVQERTRNYYREKILRQSSQLEEEIRELEQMPVRDQEILKRRRGELQELLNRNPWILCATAVHGPC